MFVFYSPMELVVMAQKGKGKAKVSGKTEDWFEALDAELEKKYEEVLEDMGEQNSKKVKINKTLISDLWKIWTRFNKINAHFTMEPGYSIFAQFEEFPYGDWRFKDGFDPARINNMQLIDRTQDQGRIGDSLKAWYYYAEKTPHLRLVFEFCEGEHYYKYSGWKRTYAQHLLYDSPLDKVSMGEIHKIFGDIVKVWYESHLRRDRDYLIKHLKKKYERSETFTQ